MSLHERVTPMTWTRDPPKVPGWYWYAEERCNTVVVHVDRPINGDGLIVWESGNECEEELSQYNYPGHWLGPLTVPKGPDDE